MSLRLDGANGTHLEMQTGVPTADYTWANWMMIRSTITAFTSMMGRMSSTSSPAAYEILAFNGGGNNQLTGFVTGGSGDTLLRALTTDVWYHCFLRRIGDAVLHGVRAHGEASYTTLAQTAGAHTPVVLNFGNDYFGDPSFPGRVEHLKVWTRGLSIEEIFRESLVGPVLYPRSLNRYLPCITHRNPRDHGPRLLRVVTAGTQTTEGRSPAIPDTGHLWRLAA